MSARAQRRILATDALETMRALVNCGAGALARYSLVLLREFRVHAVRQRARRESAHAATGPLGGAEGGAEGGAGGEGDASASEADAVFADIGGGGAGGGDREGGGGGREGGGSGGAGHRASVEDTASTE